MAHNLECDSQQVSGNGMIVIGLCISRETLLQLLDRAAYQVDKQRQRTRRN